MALPDNSVITALTKIAYIWALRLSVKYSGLSVFAWAVLPSATTPAKSFVMSLRLNRSSKSFVMPFAKDVKAILHMYLAGEAS